MKPLIKTLKTKITKTLLALVLTLCLVTGTVFAMCEGKDNPCPDYTNGTTQNHGATSSYELKFRYFLGISSTTQKVPGCSWCGNIFRRIMLIRPNGNVGFGTLDPQSTIDVKGDIRAEQLCDESGENCKDISEGWELEAAQTAIEWSEIENIPENITNQNFEKIDGNDKLTMSNHTGKFTITTLDNAYWEGLPLNMGATPFIFSIGQMVNRELGITLRNFDKEKVAYFSPNGNLEIAGDIKADGKICDGNDKCIGDSAPTTPEVPNGTLCGFCQKTGTTFSADVAGENYKTVACESKRDPCVQGCPDGWELQLLFGNRHSCVKQ